jgi:hypothetical protein
MSRAAVVAVDPPALEAAAALLRAEADVLDGCAMAAITVTATTPTSASLNPSIVDVSSSSMSNRLARAGAGRHHRGEIDDG